MLTHTHGTTHYFLSCPRITGRRTGCAPRGMQGPPMNSLCGSPSHQSIPQLQRRPGPNPSTCTNTADSWRDFESASGGQSWEVLSAAQARCNTSTAIVLCLMHGRDASFGQNCYIRNSGFLFWSLVAPVVKKTRRQKTKSWESLRASTPRT